MTTVVRFCGCFCYVQTLHIEWKISCLVIVLSQKLMFSPLNKWQKHTYLVKCIIKSWKTLLFSVRLLTADWQALKFWHLKRGSVTCVTVDWYNSFSILPLLSVCNLSLCVNLAGWLWSCCESISFFGSVSFFCGPRKVVRILSHRSLTNIVAHTHTQTHKRQIVFFLHWACSRSVDFLPSHYQYTLTTCGDALSRFCLQPAQAHVDIGTDKQAATVCELSWQWN